GLHFGRQVTAESGSPTEQSKQRRSGSAGYVRRQAARGEPAGRSQWRTASAAATCYGSAATTAKEEGLERCVARRAEQEQAATTTAATTTAAATTATATTAAGAAKVVSESRLVAPFKPSFGLSGVVLNGELCTGVRFSCGTGVLACAPLTRKVSCSLSRFAGP